MYISKSKCTERQLKKNSFLSQSKTCITVLFGSAVDPCAERIALGFPVNILNHSFNLTDTEYFVCLDMVPRRGLEPRTN